MVDMFYSMSIPDYTYFAMAFFLITSLHEYHHVVLYNLIELLEYISYIYTCQMGPVV